MSLAGSRSRLWVVDCKLSPIRANGISSLCKIRCERSADVGAEYDARRLHSRKNGDGFVDSQAKLDKIIAGIEDAQGRRSSGKL